MQPLARVVLAAVLLTAFMAHGAPQTQASAKSVGVTTSMVPIEKAGSRYASEGVVLEDFGIHYSYNADGTGWMEKHLRVKVQDEAGARAFSVLSIAYASATQTAKMVSVKVTHADGTTVMTPASDDMDLPARVTQEAPLYSDLKILQVPVRGLRAGDTLDYTMRVDLKKAPAAGEFWGDEAFLKTLVVLKGTVTLEVPADKYVQVWSPGLKPEITVANGRKVYRWSYAQPQPTQELARKKTATVTVTKPSIAWTTFPSWQALGAWYESLAAARATPTAGIVAKANEITAKARTPEAEVESIYDFVSTHVRYIGVDFGVGRYQPHAAETVLANQYGDCKDKDTLLEALLRAKGFKPAPALIGVGIKLIPDLPSPILFNHVITTVTIGGQQVWLDSTPEVAPFEMLISQIRDKQALVMPSEGPAQLERTPAKPPFPLVDRMDATGTLTADGELKAHMVIVDRSDSELLLREVARNVAPAQWDQAVQYLSRLMGFGGTVSHSEFEHGEDLEDPIRLMYDYDHPKFGDWGELRILPLFPLTGLPPVPDKEPEKAIPLGAERTEIARTEIHLPAGFAPDLPDAVHVKTDFATYDRTYSFANGVLTADRRVVVLAKKVPAKEWKAYAGFVKETSLFDGTFIQLLTVGTAKGSALTKASGAGSNATAAQLVTEADGLEKSGDYEGVLKLLDQARKMTPEQPYLWSNYGWVAMAQHDLPAAEKDFDRELKYHPDETYVWWLYAVALEKSGQMDRAMALLRAVVAKDPGESDAALLLASLEAQTDLPGAIAVLQKALAAKPGNDRIPAVLALLFLRNHEREQAAPLLVKALAGATDALALNNESYELAQTGWNLPLAEQKSREAVKEVEAETAQAEVAGANEQAFIRAAQLVADWDTLGYILMREGKLEEARHYLEAAWNSEPSMAIGLHYGLTLEGQGERAAALRVYELCGEQQTMDAPPEDRKKLTAAVARLKREHVRSTGEDPTLALQGMRTFHLLAGVAPKKFEEATFRLEFVAGGPPQVMQVNGAAGMAQFVKKIAAVHFREMVPLGSKARLVRDAAMSCSPGDRRCVLVLMPMGSMEAENAGAAN